MSTALDVSWFSRSPSAWFTIGVLTAVALLVASLVPRRAVLTALTGTSLAVILGVTIVPFGGWRHFGIETGALHSVLTNLQPTATTFTAWAGAADGPLNVVLFVPAGLLLGLLSGRPVRAAAALALLSFGIEAYQSMLTTRVGSLADVVANTLGAAVGAAAAGVGLLAARAARHPNRLPHRPLITSAGSPRL